MVAGDGGDAWRGRRWGPVIVVVVVVVVVGDGLVVVVSGGGWVVVERKPVTCHEQVTNNRIWRAAAHGPSDVIIRQLIVRQ